MPEVSFYLLKELTQEACERYACRLAHKAYQEQLQVLFYCNHLEAAQRLNDLLWTFQDISFIPHDLLSASPTEKLPVRIGYEEMISSDYDLLINLSDEIDAVFDRFKAFQQIIEIVPFEDTARKTSRKKYKMFKEAGFTLQIQDLTKA